MNARLISSATLWHLHCAQGRHDALLHWVRANGIDPDVVPQDRDLIVEDDPDGGRRIRYHAYVLTDDGHKQVDPERPAVTPMMEERTTPLVVPPPPDWPVYAAT
jgi:hypothetical protein